MRFLHASVCYRPSSKEGSAVARPQSLRASQSGLRPLGGEFLRARARQMHGGTCSLAGLTVDRDGAAVLLDDLLDRRETEAGAEGFRAEQRFEDLGHDLCRYARAGVADDEFVGTLSGARRDGYDAFIRGAARFRQGLGGIVEQIDHDPAHPVGIDTDTARGGMQIPNHGEASSRRLIVERLLEPLIARYRPATEVANLRIFEEIVDDSVAARDAALHALDRALEIPGVLYQDFLDREERIAKGAERIAQLMCDRSGQLPQGRKPLLAQNFGLGRTQLGGALMNASLQIPVKAVNFSMRHAEFLCALTRVIGGMPKQIDGVCGAEVVSFLRYDEAGTE